MVFQMNKRQAMVQDKQNRNILSETGIAVTWGNTSLNPRGGVSSFRFLQEENEQSALFYLCGPLAQLSFSVCLCPSFPLHIPHSLFTDEACSLFSWCVYVHVKFDLFPRDASLPLNSPVWPTLPIGPIFYAMQKRRLYGKNNFSTSDLLDISFTVLHNKIKPFFLKMSESNYTIAEHMW